MAPPGSASGRDQARPPLFSHSCEDLAKGPCALPSTRDRLASSSSYSWKVTGACGGSQNSRYTPRLDDEQPIERLAEVGYFAACWQRKALTLVTMERATP